MAVVLIFPSGSAVADEVCAALRGKRVLSKLVGLSSNAKDEDLTNPLIFDEVHYNAPTVTDSLEETWIDYLTRYEWTHAIPTMDSAVLLFAKLKQFFPKKQFLAPSLAACNICFSKRKTYATWPSISPKFFNYSKETLWYVKPDVGYASRGCKDVTYEEAEKLNEESALVVCERLSGPEYTIHCYFTSLIGVRQRTVTKSGMSMLSHKVQLSSEVEEMFHMILEKIEPPPGPWFFQIKGHSLLEIQPRIPGAGSTARYFWNHNGLLQWIYETNGNLFSESPLRSTRRVESPLAVPIQGLLKTFYDYIFLDREKFNLHAVVIDYDDTLFDPKTDTIDTNLIGALYCIHRKCPIYLVTRHRGNLSEHLQQYAIAFNLFDKILHLSDEKQTKWEACAFLGNKLGGALLIDDSFRDRSEWQSWSCDRDEGANILRCWKLSTPSFSPYPNTMN